MDLFFPTPCLLCLPLPDSPLELADHPDFDTLISSAWDTQRWISLYKISQRLKLIKAKWKSSTRTIMGRSKIEHFQLRDACWKYKIGSNFTLRMLYFSDKKRMPWQFSSHSVRQKNPSTDRNPESIGSMKGIRILLFSIVSNAEITRIRLFPSLLKAVA